MAAQCTRTAWSTFLGYGDPQHPPTVLFLGIEESNGGGGNIAHQVRLTQFQRIEDAQRACQLLAHDPGFINPFTSGGNPVEQWNAAARFRLALAGLPWDVPANWNRYWRHYLGRPGADTFLMECYPVPRASTNTWIPDYNPVRQWPARQQVLAQFTNRIRPRYVVAYGGPPRRHVADLFPVVSSDLDGKRRMWHPLATMRAASIGKTAHGTVVARVGFFGGGFFNQLDLPLIRDAMWRLGSGPAPLGHPWP